MSQYRMLEDHYINGNFMQVGTIQTTVDVGGLLPTGWVPTPNVEPLDAPAIAAFYAAGPKTQGLIRQVWQAFTVNKPAVYWTQLTPGLWTLVGSGLPAVPGGQGGG